MDEYRDAEGAKGYAQAIAAAVTRPWTIMEVCGGQTHAIVKYGIDSLLPADLTLLHGPGCPVCVTPLEMIDRAIELASRPEVTLCSFGDMLRVPGSTCDLLTVKARGGDVRIVYSPLDALTLAEKLPEREVVFFAVGFETTAPANAMAVFQAAARAIPNFSMLASHVLVPPAIEAVLQNKQTRIQAFLAAGHVCTIMGLEEYRPIARDYGVPIVATGFEPLDILQGVLMCVRQLEEGRSEVENQYARSVRDDGNPAAQGILRDVFEVTSRKWRGIGEIPGSGLKLREQYAAWDAERKYELATGDVPEPADCQSGLVLQGIIRPSECPAFGTRCTPERPLGATMVSSEGACAAYYRYKPLTADQEPART